MTSKKKNIRRISSSITALSKRVVSYYKPEKVILFGSHVWGKPTMESDVDVLIIKRTLKSKIERQRELRARLYPMSMPVDFIVYTPSELKKKVRNDCNLFIKDVLKNGIVLYEKNKIRR
ncbi:nucleotidyltransferase domain-containing protein [Candidatus Uhrbacteria bacterium]|nr:nucleotidyltransferase domain-containing protein [Candidatus Uhrbacteria bacterium]